MPRLALAFALFSTVLGCKSQRDASAATLRLGFFPNLTHAVALVGLARGDFASALAPLSVDARPFNAGPEEMEALFAGALDAGYVGPAPAINGYLRSRGEGFVIVAGAAENGAGLVVRKDAGIHAPGDLHGKKIASPQIGSTQDVALRVYLKENGLMPKERGGDVSVLPIANADILTLMKQKKLDGAWVPEPWTSRLLDEADGALFVDERERWPERRFPVTVLVVRRKLVQEKPELVQKLVAAHVATAAWIGAHPEEALTLVDEGLKKFAKKTLPPQLLEAAWKQVRVTSELSAAALQKQLADGRAVGFLPQQGSIDGLFERRFLDEAQQK